MGKTKRWSEPPRRTKYDYVNESLDLLQEMGVDNEQTLIDMIPKMGLGKVCKIWFRNLMKENVESYEFIFKVMEYSEAHNISVKETLERFDATWKECNDILHWKIGRKVGFW